MRWPSVFVDGRVARVVHARPADPRSFITGRAAPPLILCDNSGAARRASCRPHRILHAMVDGMTFHDATQVTRAAIVTTITALPSVASRAARRARGAQIRMNR
jgi:hypothetical protein